MALIPDGFMGTKTRSIMTLSIIIITFSITTFTIMTFSITTFTIITFSITTFNVATFSITVCLNSFPKLMSEPGIF
jgi:hypothetical protein